MHGVPHLVTSTLFPAGRAGVVHGVPWSDDRVAGSTLVVGCRMSANPKKLCNFKLTTADDPAGVIRPCCPDGKPKTKWSPGLNADAKRDCHEQCDEAVARILEDQKRKRSGSLLRASRGLVHGAWFNGGKACRARPRTRCC